MRNHINVDQITENIIRKILRENGGKPTPEEISTISAKLNHGQTPGVNLGKATNQDSDPKNTISQLANLRREQPKLFTPEINTLIKDGKYDEALTKLTPQKESRQLKLKESNMPAQKHLELANQLLTKAIDEFHLAMDSDKSLKIFPLVMQLENLETELNNNTSKTIASWGALPGEDHRPVDTGKYNPHDIDLHHPGK